MEIGENLSEKAKHDLLLLELAKKGNQAAFTELMHRYRDSIYYMMFKMVKNDDDADDLTIEAFGKAFSRLEQYSPGFAFSTWLFKIASNNCIDFIRKKKLNLTSMDVGFDNEKIVGIWIGNDDNSPMEKITGGSLPAELFAKIIQN